MMKRPIPISPIPGVPDELIRVLNDRFRMLAAGDAEAAQATATEALAEAQAAQEPAPLAPNIESASAGYLPVEAVGSIPMMRFSGWIDLPTSDGDYPHLARIKIVVGINGSTPGTSSLELSAPFGASPINYYTEPQAHPTYAFNAF
jgi:hypothetical protein